MNKQWVTGALLLLGWSCLAQAQDPLAALDNLAINLDGTLTSALQGDASAASLQLADTAATLFIDLAAGTPAESLARSGASLSRTLGDLSLALTGTIDPLTMQLAAAGAPLTEPLIELVHGLFGDGLSNFSILLPAGGDSALPLTGLFNGLSLDALTGLLGGLTLPGLTP